MGAFHGPDHAHRHVHPGDPLRVGIGGPVGSGIDIPLAHKDALYVRSHYDTITATFAELEEDWVRQAKRLGLFQRPESIH